MATTNKGSKGKGSKASAVQGVVPAVRQGERVYPTDKRDGNKVGLTHGLLLTAWYNGVFDMLAAGLAVPLAHEGNTLPVYSDDTIAEAVRAEYPGRANVAASNGGYQSTAAYRGYYNGQRHGLGATGYKAPSAADYAKQHGLVVPITRSGKAKAVPSVPAVQPATPSKASK